MLLPLVWKQMRMIGRLANLLADDKYKKLYCTILRFTDQLGSSTLVVHYFPDTEQGKGMFETGQYGKMASTVQSCIEDAAGVPLDVILGGSLLNARKRNQTSEASARDGNLKMLRKEVRDKMLESINGFLSTAGKPLRVELPSAELERRCPFVLAAWPEILVHPSAMRMHEARQVLEMETISVEACEGCERCGAVPT